MVCYMKYDSITMHTPIFTMYSVCGSNKINAIKLKTQSFDNMCFIHLNKQNAGVLGWPLKVLQSPYSKVCLTSSLLLLWNGRIFLAFNAPSQFFLRESRKAAAWWEHCIFSDSNLTGWCKVQGVIERVISKLDKHDQGILKSDVCGNHACSHNYIILIPCK